MTTSAPGQGSSLPPGARDTADLSTSLHGCKITEVSLAQLEAIAVEGFDPTHIRVSTEFHDRSFQRRSIADLEQAVREPPYGAADARPSSIRLTALDHTGGRHLWLNLGPNTCRVSVSAEDGTWARGRFEHLNQVLVGCGGGSPPRFVAGRWAWRVALRIPTLIVAVAMIPLLISIRSPSAWLLGLGISIQVCGVAWGWLGGRWAAARRRDFDERWATRLYHVSAPPRLRGWAAFTPAERANWVVLALTLVAMVVFGVLAL
ncbi:hypothetical protein [Yinghuangia aomiensis]